MKKFVFLAALAMVMCFGSRAQSQDLPLVGDYTNEAGQVVIAKAPAAEGNYVVAIQSADGKCLVQIEAATNQVTAQGQDTGATFHPNTIVAVDSQTYPAFSLWPEDQTIRLADDALPFDKLDPACQVFKGNMVFTRK